jgi:TPR repeat protein
LKELSKAGSADAQCLLGTVYLEGLIFPRDPTMAKTLFQESAKQGNDTAKMYLRLFEWSKNRDSGAMPDQHSNQ